MRVALVFTPFWDAPCPPLGISYIKGAIQELSECKIFDLNMRHGGKKGMLSQDELTNRAPDIFRKDIGDIISFNPDIVGFSLFHLNYQTALYIMNRIKAHNPEIITIIGGPHATYVSKDLMKGFNFIDFCIIGEGEDAFRTLIESLKSNQSIEHPNIITRKKSIFQTMHKSRKKEAQVISVFPEFDDFNLDAYPVRMLPILLSRGCTQKCSYCGLPYVLGQYRCRNPEEVLQEITRDMERYNVKNFLFTDALINSNEASLEALCDLIINKGLDIKYGAEAFPEISKDLLQKMYNSGCRFLWISPETGSQRLMDEVFNKNVDIERARETIKKASEIGIDISTWFMIGSPSETEEDLEKTIDFAGSIRSYCVELTFVPFYVFLRSDMFKEYKKYNIKRLIRLGHHDIFFDYISDKGGIYPHDIREHLAQKLWREFNEDQPYAFDSGVAKALDIYSYSDLFINAFKK